MEVEGTSEDLLSGSTVEKGPWSTQRTEAEGDGALDPFQEG